MIDLLAAWMWPLIACAVLGCLLCVWYWVRQDPDRGAADSVAAVRRDNERRLKETGIFAIFLRTPVGADPVATGTATVASPGVGLEPTVRLAPQQWASPIPQDVLDHVWLQQYDQQSNTGRHWRAES